MEVFCRHEVEGEASFYAKWAPNDFRLYSGCDKNLGNIWMKSGDATIVPGSSGELKFWTVVRTIIIIYQYIESGDLAKIVWAPISNEKKELQKRGENQKCVPLNIVRYNYFDQCNIMSKHMYENQMISISVGSNFEDLNLGSLMKMK
ncbi:hypothetical protein NE237_013044 [Protea cynaroides]|uniref:Uncharacterized protein n=1 Tax=Protea cynaroides TaxID=273540 RepID=A0A9Q0H085_9MAGN|nr:hypothetical protein NE237_013044 [Protea cynaroides]